MATSGSPPGRAEDIAPASNSNMIVQVLTKHPLWTGLIVRLLAAWLLPLLLDNFQILPGVAYTDIDYYVFTDAARHVREGRSPYKRHTYRYTPFLACFLAPLPFEAGRFLFCIADAVCGYIVILLRQYYRQCVASNPVGDDKQSLSLSSQKRRNISLELQDALWWMYNPLAINICTRGSAESLVVLLPVLLTVAVVVTTSGKRRDRKKLYMRAGLAGTIHGIAVHSKLYPIIYTLSFMAYFALLYKQPHGQSSTSLPASTAKSPNFPWMEPTRLAKLVWLWIQRFLTPPPLIFFATFFFSAAGLTYLAFIQYGMEALQEGMLYHLSRVDHRHNYSIFWYGIYLAKGTLASVGGVGDSNTYIDMDNNNTNGIYSMAWVGRLLMLPQLVLLVYTSLGVAPRNLGVALFVQTFVFVAHNKVITAQYFTWYLCLLPLCSNFEFSSKKTKTALALLGISIVTWLLSAYCLEMQGMAVHRVVWVASLGFFAANVNFMGALLYSEKGKEQASSLHQPQRLRTLHGNKSD